MQESPETSRKSSAAAVMKRFFRHENAVLGIVFIVVVAAMGIATKGASVARTNIANVALQSAIRGIASVGQAFVILSAGIDVSVGGVALFCGVLGAAIMTDSWVNIVGHPVPFNQALPLMLIAGTAWGFLNGGLVSRLRMPALIVTLGMWQISYGAGFQVGGGQSITFLPDALEFVGGGRIAGVPVPVTIFIAVAVVAYFVLNHTSYGRSVYATGGNPVSAWLSGVNVSRILLSVYVISGFLAGLAGVISVAKVMSATMVIASGLEIDSIACCSVGGISLAGGKGSLVGVVLGVFIIGVLNNAMSLLGANPALQGIVKGSIIIVSVAADYIRRSR